MKKKSLLFISLLVIFSSLFAYDIEEDWEEGYLDTDAQNDMIAFVQYTSPYRFSSDLSAGDKIIYQSKDQADELISMEVIRKNVHEFEIQEKFEGNTVNYIIDFKTMKVISLSGSDEDGRWYECNLLSDYEVIERIQQMKEIGSIQLSPQNSKKSELKIADKKLKGTVFKSSLRISASVNELQSMPEISFSGDVPCMLPVKISVYVFNNEALFSTFKEGFVENEIYQVKEFKKRGKK